MYTVMHRVHINALTCCFSDRNGIWPAKLIGHHPEDNQLPDKFCDIICSTTPLTCQ